MAKNLLPGAATRQYTCTFFFECCRCYFLFQLTKSQNNRTARYVLHLRDAFKLPLAQAYSTAVAQFRSLKATLEAATRFAQLEAESYGADFGSGRIGAGVKAEEKMLDLWDAQHGASSSNDNSTSLSAILANSGVDQTPQSLPWTRAKDYLQGMHFRESPAAEAKPSGDTEAEVPAAESVLSATRLMDVMGGGASKRERRPTEQPRGPKRQSSEARQTNRERQTHRAVNHMVRSTPFYTCLHSKRSAKPILLNRLASNAESR